jgi:hypothetical protein
MNYGYADRGTIVWSESQGRFELRVYEGGHSLYTWILPQGFEAPELAVMPGRSGIEEINARLADAGINPSGLNSWDVQTDNSWARVIHPARPRNQNDH